MRGRLEVLVRSDRSPTLVMWIALWPLAGCADGDAPRSNPAGTDTTLVSLGSAASPTPTARAAPPASATPSPPWRFPPKTHARPAAPVPDPTKLEAASATRCPEGLRHTLFVFHGRELKLALETEDIQGQASAFTPEGGRPRELWPLAAVESAASGFQTLTVWPCRGEPLAFERAQVLENAPDGRPRLVLAVTGKQTLKLVDRTDGSAPRLKNVAAIVASP